MTPGLFTGIKGAKAPNGRTMVTMYHRETGEAVTTSSINASEAIAGGWWLASPPVAAPVAIEALAVDAPTPETPAAPDAEPAASKKRGKKAEEV